MRQISKRSVLFFFACLLSFGNTLDLFVPNFDPIVLKNLNIEYQWFENLLEFNTKESDCRQIDAQLPQIEFAYNTIQNFHLASGEDTMKDLDNIRKLMGSLEIALDQQYEEKILNQSQFTQELSNVQRELKKKIATQVLDSNSSKIDVVQWTDDLNETQYLSKISEESYLLSIKKEILDASVNENTNNQATLIKDANSTVTQLMILLEDYFQLYYKSQKVNEEMILIFQLNSYIQENEMNQFDTQKLEQSFNNLKEEFLSIYKQIQQIQKLYQKMKNLLTQMIQKIELISEDKEFTQNEQTELNDIIQKYQILSSIFQGIQQQEESNKTLSQLVQKKEYLTNYQNILKNLNDMYSDQLIEVQDELKMIENNSYAYALKQDTIVEIMEQQSKLNIQMSQIQEELNTIINSVQLMQQQKEQSEISYNQLEQEQTQISKKIEQLELNISQVQNWLHNSLKQIQNYTEIKLAYENKLEILKNSKKKDELKNAEYNIKVISDWLPEQQKKYISYQQLEENLFVELNELQKKKNEIKEKISQISSEEETNKFQFSSFVESQAEFIYNNKPAELESLLIKSQKTMKELDKLKQGQSLLLQEYEKLVKEKQESFSMSTQFQNFLEMKGFDYYNSKTMDPEYRSIIQSDEFKAYQQSQEINFIEKQNELIEQQKILAQLNSDIAAKEDELQTITVNVDACVITCSQCGHKSEGEQDSITGSKLSNSPADDVSSTVKGSKKAKISMKENYVHQKPEVSGKQYGEQEDEQSRKSIREKIDVVSEEDKTVQKENWSSFKKIGDFSSNVSTSIKIYIDPVQNNITTMIHFEKKVFQEISTKIVFLEQPIDRKSNKQVDQFSDRISEKHLDFVEYDLYNSKAKLVDEDKVSSIVKITWTSVIGSIMEGEPEDEVSSTVVINGRIQTSSKSYSGKIQDEKDIQTNNNFEDEVSSEVKSKPKKNEISHKDNYVKQGIIIAQATSGIIQEAISIRQQGKIKSSAYSALSGDIMDEVSSKANYEIKDDYSEKVQKIEKDKKWKKSKTKFSDKKQIKTKEEFGDEVSSRIEPQEEDKMFNKNTWKSQPDLVSSKALQHKSSYFIKTGYKTPEDEVSSQVKTQDTTIIHVHKLIEIKDQYSEAQKIKAVSKYAIKRKQAFRSRLAIKVGWQKQPNIISSRAVDDEQDEVSSKIHKSQIDIISHDSITAPEDQVSSTVHSNPKSIYAIRAKKIEVKNKISSKAINKQEDKYAYKPKYELIDKYNIKSKYEEKDSVSSKIEGEIEPKIAVKSTDGYEDEVGSTVVGEIQSLIKSIISIDEIEDEVSSTIISDNPIATSHKAYSGALINEAAGQTTFVDYMWVSTDQYFLEQPQNNITTRIIIYKEQFTNNISTSILKYVHITHNISSQISWIKNLCNDVSTSVIGEQVDEVSSKAEPGKKNKIAMKQKYFGEDQVNSKVESEQEDEVSSKVVNEIHSLISEKIKKIDTEEISIKKSLSKEDKLAIKVKAPVVKPRYSGKQTEWPRKHTYSGMISKCDCEDEVSSIVEGLPSLDYYSKKKIDDITNLISSAHEFSYKSIIGLQFGGTFLDEVSSKAVYEISHRTSVETKFVDSSFIGSRMSSEQFDDEVSSHVHSSSLVQASSKSYSGKIQDYLDIETSNNFEDEVSSHINKYQPNDLYSSKLLLKALDIVESKSSWTGPLDNITTDITRKDQTNNVTTSISDNPEIHNISTSIKIFEAISHFVSSEISFITEPEDEVSSITHATYVAIYADVVSWIEFEDEVSSKVQPGTEPNEISEKIKISPKDEISQEDNYQPIDKFTLKSQHSFLEAIHQKYKGKLINKAISMTSFTPFSNITTQIYKFKPIEITNITTQIIKFVDLTNNVTTDIVEHKPINVHNISTSMVKIVEDANNISSSVTKFVITKQHNISSSIVIFKEAKSMISTAFSGSVYDESTHKLYDGGIEQNEKSSKTSFTKYFNNITTDIVLFGEIENYCSTKIIIYKLENLAASKTSYKEPINNISTSIVIFKEMANNISSAITDFNPYNNISSYVKIYADLQNYASTAMFNFAPIEDEVHSKAISELIDFVSSIISDIELEDEVSSKISSKEKDRISVMDEIPIPIDIIHAKDNVFNQNKTARQSLVDYWVCDYVGEVFSYVNHKTTANVPDMENYQNQMNSNILINTARNLALLLKNATYEKAKLKPSNHIDQLLQLTNSQSINGLNIHYYTQLRELLKAVKTEIDYFYIVLAKQQQLFQKRNAYKSLIENLSKQKDKCMVKKQTKSNLRRRSDV